MPDELSNSENSSNQANRRSFTGRRLIRLSAVIAGIVFLLAIGVFIFFKSGAAGSLVESQFRAKLLRMGLEFKADEFRLELTPLTLVLKNAAFNDAKTGDKILFIRDAKILLSIDNLLAWQISRDVSVRKTDIEGAELWIKFDENGRSNLANLVEDTYQSRINLKYDSASFNLRGAVIYFGDLARRLDAEARNVSINAKPAYGENASDPLRFEIEAAASDSVFSYDGKPVRNISLQLRAITDGGGADITHLKLDSGVGSADLSGKVISWSPFRYQLSIDSSADVGAISEIFPIGTKLSGSGNFNGTVSGEGEKYSVDGMVKSGEITAEGVYLKGVNISGTAAGVNQSYDVNGTAIAELLTAGDFRIDFPRLVGNVRGTGTDFRWLGELQAIAVRSGAGSIMGLYLKDALAELKDREFAARAGSGLAREFDIAKTSFRNLSAADLRLAMKSGGFLLSAPFARADSFKTKDYQLLGLSGRELTVNNVQRRTDVTARNLASQTAVFGDTRLSGISADRFEFTDLPTETKAILRNVRADSLQNSGTRLNGLFTEAITIDDTPAATSIASDSVRFASLNSNGASLGSVNVAGVRLTIRQGRLEARSADINAGDVLIEKGSLLASGGKLEAVKLGSPLYILEPSGRYRASADMSIGGGILGSITLGAVSANLRVSNGQIVLDGLRGRILDGDVNAAVSIALDSNGTSSINARFENLDLSKLVAAGTGKAVPLSGTSSGDIAITFPGTDYRSASGTLRAAVSANAGTAGQGEIPINGNINIAGSNGLFEIDNSQLQSANTRLLAAGRFDAKGTNTNLRLNLASTDAREVDRLARLFSLSPEFETRLDEYQASFGGSLDFDGHLTGNIADPEIDAAVALGQIYLRGRNLGSLSVNLRVDPETVRLDDGQLKDPTGGKAEFAVIVPRVGVDNVSVTADLSGIDAANLIAALPVSLPETLRDLTGKASGRVEISGLPNKAAGEIKLAFGSGTVSGRAFDALRADLKFDGTAVTIDSAEISASGGNLKASGRYDRATEDFDFALKGRDVPLPLALAFVPTGNGFPTFDGRTDIDAKIQGNLRQTERWVVDFDGTARNVTVNDNPFGEVKFSGVTRNSLLNASLTALFEGRPQVISASLNFADRQLPINVETAFDQSPLDPYFSIIPQLRGISIGGNGTGSVKFGGNLARYNDKGEREITLDALEGIAQFSSLEIRLQETNLAAARPIEIRFSPSAIDFISADFSGSGSNVSIAGRKAIAADAANNFQINGRLNLAVLNAFPQISLTDTFFGGFADVGIRITGPNSSARLSGTAALQNAAVATFVGTGRITFDRLQGKILFTSNQAQLQDIVGYLGGGKFTAEGGAVFGDTLRIEALRLGLEGSNVTVPLPTDFITTGDASIEVSGRQIDGVLGLQISGRIRAKRSIYNRNIDLANVVGSRRESSLSGGRTTGIPARFDLTIEGRDALIVKNNIADLTASAILRLTGTTDNPQLSGRITATGGTLFFRNDRYVIQRGVLEFPPDSDIDPNLYLQAETEIKGYQIFVNLSGRLSDTETLNAAVRSVPALPTQDVLSLITTGSLANTESGLPSIAQTGINTAAEVLTDSIINNPVRKATDRLFGLNVFEIDPIISGERLNPSARLTVGRQINNNLRVTYATNLSQDQNQVVALEYRLSNKLSVIAQYEQRPLSNVTRNRDNFSIEVRFRRRF